MGVEYIPIYMYMYINIHIFTNRGWTGQVGATTGVDWPEDNGADPHAGSQGRTHLKSLLTPKLSLCTHLIFLLTHVMSLLTYEMSLLTPLISFLTHLESRLTQLMSLSRPQC